MKTLKMLLFYVLMVGCSVYVESISGITNYQDEVNTIGQDDRRAATFDETKSEPDLQASPTHQKSNVYLPPSYDSSGYDHSPGYDHSSGYDHSPGYHTYYYQPPTYYNHAQHGYENYDHGGGDQRGQGHAVGHESGGSKSSFFSALALKGILIPLAGIALLGAAAALSTNPVLLQLGVLNGRRKRSVADDNVYPANPNLKPPVER